MHFKCAVILCALYLVTVTQSMGLNEEQVKNIVKIFGKQKNRIDLITLELCRKYNLDFEHKRGRTNAQKVQDLLVFLATNDKNLDDWKLSSLSSYEVAIYIGVFNEYDLWFDHSGQLGKSEVKKVVDALNLEGDVKKKLADAIKKIFNVLMKDSDSLLSISSETINAPKFLDAFLKVKPKGRGLNKKLILELILLYKYHKIDSKHIDPVEITKFFLDLSIVKKEHEDLLVFDSIRTAAFQLQELLLVLAEYNKETKEEPGTVYSTDSVRDVLSNFSNNDVNKNGLLSKQELKGIEEPQYQIEDVDTVFKEFDMDGDGHLNIAEFCLVVFAKHERLNAEKAEHERMKAEKEEHEGMNTEKTENEGNTLRRRIVKK